MKNISLILIFSFLVSFSYGQEINTLFKRDTSKTFVIGGYGEPFAGVTQLNNDWGLMLGIKGGVTFKRSFSFGPIAKINVGLWEFQGDNLNLNNSANLELYMGSAGIFVEYIFKMKNKIHFSIPVNIMVGGASIKEDLDGIDFDMLQENDKYDVESSGLFIIEPELNVDFNISKFFIPNLKFGYRAVFGSQMINVTDEDLSGVYFGIGLKFGKF